jgi:hypothetical protein
MRPACDEFRRRTGGGSCEAWRVKIVLGACLDGGGWPGPCGPGGGRGQRDDGARTAVLDEVWVGVDGFVDVLAVRTGCATLDPPGMGERAADLARRLRAADDGDAPWAASLAADPLATARALLGTRDALLAAGVDDDTPPASLPPRLQRVLAATRGAQPGTLERATEIARLLQDGWPARLDAVAVVDDPALLPAPVRRVLRALADAGTPVTLLSPETAADVDDVGDNDLARARALLSGRAGGDDLVLRGDGSLVLLRNDTVDETAAEVAAFLAAQPGSLVVTPDGDGGLVLDEALARAHAPPLGVRGDAGADALLALLPLVVAVGDDPVDPARLFELCTLPLSPLPRGVGGRLKNALLRVPSTRAEAAQRAVDEGLRALRERTTLEVGEDAATARVAALRARIDALVPSLRAPPVSSTKETSTMSETSATSTAALRERLLLLLRFLQGRKNREFDALDDKTPYRAAIRQTTTALSLLQLLDAPTLSPPQLLRLLQTASAGVRPQAPHAASAGFVVVDDPGAVLGPARTIAWWAFSQASGHLRPMRAFSRAEHAALVRAGFSPPSPDDVAREHALRQRRPFDAAVERLVLCCPRRGEDGAEHHPHPLWDELLARLPARARLAAGRAVVRPEDGQPDLVARVAVDEAPAPRPRRVHRVPGGAIAPRDVVSPSREELLLGCPFRFALVERGVGMSAWGLKSGAQLEGDVVHAVLARVLQKRPASADDAATLARACFLDVVEVTASAWLLPRRRQYVLRVQERAVRAARDLVALLVDNGFVVRAVEETVKKTLPPLSIADGAAPVTWTLEGTPDVVVEGPLGVFVVDHKTGGDARKRQALAVGAALQLVDYAALAGERGKPWPGFGYYQLRTRRLLTTDDRIRGADVVAGPAAKDAWKPLERARAATLRALHEGAVVAAGVSEDEDDVVDDPHVDRGVLRIAPPCWSCRADVLCGRAFAATTKIK